MLAKHLGDIGLVITFTIAAALLALNLRVPWWRTDIGRNVFSLHAVIVLVLGLGIVRLAGLVPDSAFWWLRVGMFAALTVILGRRLHLMFREQRGRR